MACNESNSHTIRRCRTHALRVGAAAIKEEAESYKFMFVCLPYFWTFGRCRSRKGAPSSCSIFSAIEPAQYTEYRPGWTSIDQENEINYKNLFLK